MTPSLGAILLGVAILPAQTPLKTVQVASGLSRPVDVQAPAGDRARIFIVEQTGLIRILKNGRLLANPFLDLRGRIVCCGERGLLGLAFHPGYANNGHFFVNYTQGAGTMVERYTVSANPDIADPNSRKVILGPITQPYTNHNGGCLQFGKDGYLYIGLGDGGYRGDPQCRSQRGDTLLGKMLRIDVNTTAPYAIPPTNPFVNNKAVRDEIWAVGLRNPWRYCFDSLTGDLYIADVGQDAREEINVQLGTSKGGENYGWKIMEGNLCYGTGNCPSLPACGNPAYVRPVHDYGRTTGRSVTGGYVYRGCAIPDLKGTYFFGDYATRRIWSFRYTGGGKLADFTDRTAELSWTGQISSFGIDGCGEIYMCSYGTSGSVYKIVPASPPPVVDLGFGKVGGNGRVPTFEACGLLTSGNSAEFRLYNAPSSALGLLMIGVNSNPTPLFGGTIVPLPIRDNVVLAMDQNGEVKFNAPGGGGPYSLYTQFLILDPKASFGLGISNALRVDVQR